MKIFRAEFIYHACLMPRPLSLSVSVSVGISGLSSHMAFSDFLQSQEVSVRQGSVGSHHRVYSWPHQGNWVMQAFLVRKGPVGKRKAFCKCVAVYREQVLKTWAGWEPVENSRLSPFLKGVSHS